MRERHGRGKISPSRHQARKKRKHAIHWLLTWRSLRLCVRPNSFTFGGCAILAGRFARENEIRTGGKAKKDVWPQRAQTARSWLAGGFPSSATSPRSTGPPTGESAPGAVVGKNARCEAGFCLKVPVYGIDLSQRTCFDELLLEIAAMLRPNRASRTKKRMGNSLLMPITSRHGTPEAQNQTCEKRG